MDQQLQFEFPKSRSALFTRERMFLTAGLAGMFVFVRFFAILIFLVGVNESGSAAKKREIRVLKTPMISSTPKPIHAKQHPLYETGDCLLIVENERDPFAPIDDFSDVKKLVRIEAVLPAAYEIREWRQGERFEAGRQNAVAYRALHEMKPNPVPIFCELAYSELKMKRDLLGLKR